MLPSKATVTIETRQEVRQHSAETLLPQKAAKQAMNVNKVAVPMTDPSNPSAFPMPRRRDERLPGLVNSEILAAKVYGVMAVTTLATFATLRVVYELFFRPDIFA